MMNGKDMELKTINDSIQTIDDTRAFTIIESIHPGNEGLFADPISEDIRIELIEAGYNPYVKVLKDVYSYESHLIDEKDKLEQIEKCQSDFDNVLIKYMQYQVRCLYAKLLRLVSDEIKSFNTGIDIIDIIKSSSDLLGEYYDNNYDYIVNVSCADLVFIAESIAMKDNKFTVMKYNAEINQLFIHFVGKMNNLLCKIIPLYNDKNPDVYIRSLDMIYSSFGNELARLFFQLLNVLVIPTSLNGVYIENNKEDKENEN